MQNHKSPIFPMCIVLCLTVFASSSATAQIENAINETPTSLDIEQISYILNSPVTLPTNETNEIFIQQIGLGNQAHVNTITQGSEITLEQNGSNNKTLLDVNAKTYVGHLVQDGNANLFIENSKTPSLNLERNVSQIGNNHNVMIYGSNDLTKNIRLTIEGSAKTLMIRNFK